MINNYISQFLSYLEVEKRYSIHTLKSYSKDLEDFASYIEDKTAILEEISNKDIRNWIVSLSKLNLQNSSINRKLASLRSFYRFMIKNEFVTKDPTKLVKSKKKNAKLPVYVQEEQMVEVVGLYENGSLSLRSFLIIELLYHTGIRVSELVGLEINDIDFSLSLIKVLGKRDKERLIPVSDSLLLLVKLYINETSELRGLKNELFLTDKGKIIYQKFVYRIVNSYIRIASQGGNVSPHKLRHSFATHMLNNGADINSVKDLLGHASLAATQVYTHNNISDLVKILKKTHPKG